MITGDNVLTGIRIAKESGMISPEKKVLACTVVDDNEAWLWVDEDEKETMLPSFDELKDPSCPYELAVSGEVWESMKTLEPETASQLVEIIRIFGRCTPAHKVSVVATSVNLGFITLMCGDGGKLLYFLSLARLASFLFGKLTMTCFKIMYSYFHR
jgi:magnesium-transporting ATPase (P-type)